MVAVVSEHLALKRVGRRYQGLCPFHAEKTPSFSVNPELGLYHCFGCGVGRRRHPVRPGDRAPRLRHRRRAPGGQGRHHAPLRRRRRQPRTGSAATASSRPRRPPSTSTTGSCSTTPGPASPAATSAAGASTATSPGRSPSAGRPTATTPCRSTSSSRSSPARTCVDAGLAFVNRVNKLQDFFRARVMFPIFDVRGDPVAFGGRALEGGPKYKNSPESPIYQKSRVLYGLNWAKPDIVARSEAVICEGYTDVIAFFGAGVPRAVATCGTALAEDHVRVLRNFAPNLVLAYDADDAGQNAALRDLPVGGELRDPPVGGRPPAGPGPGRRRPGRPGPAGGGGRRAPGRSSSSGSSGSCGPPISPVSEGRAAAAKAAVAIIAEHPNDLVRDQYLMQLADRVGIDVDRLRRAAASRREPAGPTASGPPGRRTTTATAPPAGPRPDGGRSAAGGGARAGAGGRPARRRTVRSIRWCTRRTACWPSSATFHEALERAGGEVHDLLQRLAVEDLPWGDDAAHVCHFGAGATGRSGRDPPSGRYGSQRRRPRQRTEGGVGDAGFEPFRRDVDGCRRCRSTVATLGCRLRRGVEIAWGSRSARPPMTSKVCPKGGWPG